MERAAETAILAARLEFARNGGVLSTSTYARLVDEFGLVADDLIEAWEAEGLAE